MARPEGEARTVEIRALGEWEVRVDGARAENATNVRGQILHALVLSRGQLMRDDLFELLDWDLRDRKARSRLSTHLSKLRSLGLWIENANPIRLHATDNLDIDLWRFFDDLGDPTRWPDAARLVAGGKEPDIPFGEDADNEIWRLTLEQFAAGVAQLDAVVPAPDAAADGDPVAAERDRLLRGSLTGRRRSKRPISSIREQVEHLHFPWRQEGESDADERQVYEALADVLESGGPQAPRRVVLVGPPGAGKRLAGIMTFVELADRFAARGRTGPVPIHVDGITDAMDAGFPHASWYQRKLASMGARRGQRAIAVVTRADAYLARHADDLDTVLGTPLLLHTDVLLCASDRFYDRHMVSRDYATHVFELEPWDDDQRAAYAEAVYGEGVSRQLERWLGQSRPRHRLCTVPLHLVLVLEQIATDGDLRGVSSEAELFERVARHRLLRVPVPADKVDERMDLLASVAHRFYVDARANVASAIRFRRPDLVDHLHRFHGYGRSKATHVATALEADGLLLAADSEDDLLQFEETSWGWFFVARHIARTLRRRPDRALVVLQKFLSPEVALFYGQMLRDALASDPEMITEALRSALYGTDDGSLPPERRRVARQQIAYFLGAIGDARVRAQLRPLMDPGSHDYESDHWVRRGVAFGLADGGLVEAGEQYVEALRAEVAAGGPTPQRDCNVGFLLTFRGDQPFDPAAPDAIEGQTACTQAVTQLVRGLSYPDQDASRRIRLFSLLDLGRHPSIDHDTWRCDIARHAEALRDVHDHLRAAGTSWPELEELQRLLDDLPGGET